MLAFIPRPTAETLLAQTTPMRKMLFILLRRVREASANAHHLPTPQEPKTTNKRPQTTNQAHVTYDLSESG